MFWKKSKEKELEEKKEKLEALNLELEELKGGDTMVFKPLDKKVPKPIEVPEEPQKPKERWVVVKELPLQPMRKYKDEETGEIVNLITIEEYLTEQANARSE